MTVESLPLRQSSRNEVVTSLLARRKVPQNLPEMRTGRTAMMDRRGEGVPVILERSPIYAANPLASGTDTYLG